jgi:D-alanyl-D-alanine carboxypeptidase
MDQRLGYWRNSLPRLHQCEEICYQELSLGNNARPHTFECHYRFSLELKKLVKKFAIAVCLLLAFPNFSIQPAAALDSNSVASIFSRIASNSALANPAVIVIDEKTGQVVFEKNSDSPRKPASILKLVSAAAAYSYLQPSQRFTTSVWAGKNKKSIVIQGSLDPWISPSDAVAKRMGRTSLPSIATNTFNTLKRENTGSIRNSTIYYSKLYPQDVAALKTLLIKHGVRAKFKFVTSQQASDFSSHKVLTSDSPELQDILAFTLLWSDNILAERIARLASGAAGHSLDDSGISQTFTQVLDNLGIEANQLVVRDGSGLSRENQMTAKTVGELLLKIRENEKFSPLLGDLPIGGISGTLRNRFTKTAPQAVGLIKAKTGRLYDTANLAGYIESGDREYAFVIFADKLSKINFNRARNTMDLLLGKIAYPILPGVIEEPLPQLGETGTTTT